MCALPGCGRVVTGRSVRSSWVIREPLSPGDQVPRNPLARVRGAFTLGTTAQVTAIFRPAQPFLRPVLAPVSERVGGLGDLGGLAVESAALVLRPRAGRGHVLQRLVAGGGRGRRGRS